MSSRLVAAKLENIQSWKEDSQVIHLTPDVVNVIRAQSETGKSVFFKVFYQMVFPNYYKYGRKNDLIRKGCQKAQATYWLENGTIIKFHLEHSTQHFEMQKDGEQNKVYYTTEMPQEIIDEFGLIVDKPLKFILNIFTKDNQYPFVTTSKSWNASALNQVFCDQEVENSLVNLKIWEKEVKERMIAVKQVYDYRKRLAEDIPYTDIEKLKNNQVIVKEIAKQYDALDDILTQLKNLEKAHSVLQQYDYKINNIVEINDIKKLVLTIDRLIEALAPLERNLMFVDSLPDNVIDMQLINNLKDYMIKLNNVFESLKVIAYNQNIVNNIPDLSKQTADIEICKRYMLKGIALFEQLLTLDKQTADLSYLDTKYKYTVEALEELNKSKAKIDEVENYKAKLHMIYSKSAGMYNTMCTYMQLCQKVEEANKELADLKAEYKVCPTCNRPFE